MKLRLTIAYKVTEIYFKEHYLIPFKYRISSEDLKFIKSFESKEEVKIYLDIINKKLGKRIYEKDRIKRFKEYPAMVYYLKNK